MTESFYLTYEASNDNFEAQIYVADIKFIFVLKMKTKYLLELPYFFKCLITFLCCINIFLKFPLW